MNEKMKTGKRTAISLGILIGIIALPILIYKVNYHGELRKIKRELNSIEGASVLNIWGHDDIELEEIAARIKIEGKGTIVLGSLSEDVFNYPKHVYVQEINGKSFQCFSCYETLGIGGSIDIGTEGYLAAEINKEFKSPREVIENFGLIEKVIDSLPILQNLRHFVSESGNGEEFIGVIEGKSIDQDPIFNLAVIEGKFEFAKSLNWKNKKCKE
ncbi:MAG: hypothetical protein H6577_12325 [Lewinellaceae bacterium]|nr:hypothetical protein [Lewinellaceae bacterium]